MTLNDILTKQNILNAVLLKNDQEELSKELKVKIVRIRIAYNRIKSKFEDEVKEFESNLVPKELIELQKIKEGDRTLEDLKKIEEITNKVNSEYAEFLQQKGSEEILFTTDDSFSEEEFNELIGINAGNDITINGHKASGETLMEAFYIKFIEKN